MTQDYVDLMLASDDREAPPGDAFRYSNYDTIALSFLVEASTKKPFSDYFSDEIWAHVRAEKEGAWIHTRNNQVVAYSGFSAAPRDWIRIGLYVLDAVEEDSCFGRFMRDAAKKQVDANMLTFSYGYQIWTDCVRSTDTFCFHGYGGQLLFMSPSKRLVMHAHSVSESVNGVWEPVFGLVWSRLK